MTHGRLSYRSMLTAGVVMALGSGAANAGDFNLEALIEAARAEPQLSIFDSTGKITTMAEAFAAKYGLEAAGTKAKAEAQIEMFAREAQAGNVQADVAIISDAPAVLGQLIPTGAVESWVPTDLAEKIPTDYHDPLVVVSSANIFTYNTELNETCPISNVWELTEPEWKGRLAMQDPLGNGGLTNWFNQMEMHADEELAAAYESHFGSPIDVGDESATKAFIKALAANGPLLGGSDSDAADAVGAPGQSEAFMGLMSSAKYRDNSEKEYKLGICAGLEPFIGFTSINVGVIAKGTDSPNAAKLFLHYAMTGEGIAPQADDGKMSSNSEVGLPADEPSGIGAVLDQVLMYRLSTALDDWDTRQDWQDFWRLSYSR